MRYFWKEKKITVVPYTYNTYVDIKYALNIAGKKLAKNIDDDNV